jgi:acetyl-CoA carboxylase alpha subunit
MLAGALGEELDDLAKLSPEAVRAARREKFLAIG